MSGIADLPFPNPWHPMTKPIDLKHIGKLIEELTEASSAAARCMIQGVNEREPVTDKLNKTWLEEELADVMANIDLCITHFDLDVDSMYVRRDKKKRHLSTWHGMLD